MTTFRVHRIGFGRWRVVASFTLLYFAAACGGGDGSTSPDAPSGGAVSQVTVANGTATSDEVGAVVPVTVRATNTLALGVRGVAITPRGPGVFEPAQGTTDGSGNVTFGWTLPSFPGTYSATFEAVGGRAASATVDAVPVAMSMVVEGSALSGEAGQPLPDSVRVRVVRARTNAPLAGAVVRFAVASGGGSVSTLERVTDAAGRAAVHWTLGISAGAQTLRADVPPTANQAGTSATVTASALQAALASLTVAPSPLTLTVGNSQALTVTPTRANAQVAVTYQYTSSNPTVASVTNTTGVVTAVGPGTATITVQGSGSGSGLASTTRSAPVAVTVQPQPDALTALTVSPASLSLTAGASQLLSPQPQRANSTVAVSYSYSSSNSAVATVSSGGTVTGVAPGTAIITVEATGSGSGFTTSTRQATAVVTVQPQLDALTALTVSPASLSLTAGMSQPLSPQPQRANSTVAVSYSYSSSNSAVATVSSGGTVTGVAPGTATITVQATGSGNGFTTSTRQATAVVTVQPQPDALTALTVSPASLSLTAGTSQPLSPQPQRANSTVAVSYSYSSSNSAVATVSSGGTVTGVAPGTASITVTATGSGAGFAPATRTAAVSVTVTGALGVGFGTEQFALIPAGTFQMGQTGIATPVRQVTISRGFLMQMTEVTQAQWRQVMQGTGLENPSQFSSCGETCPVERVNWNNIQQFLTRLNQQDPGKNYRLPTEAEWEYAARAGTTGDYGGNGVLNDMGWWSGNSGSRTHPVAQKLANAWGLYDMHGNVWEWVNDWFSATYYSTGSDVDPQGPTSGASRVLRGGSWVVGAINARSAYRDNCMPSFSLSGNCGGFRLARTP